MPDGTVAIRPKPSYFAVDFTLTPFTVAWEITRSCALACVHCRAEAMPRRDPRELTTEEGCRLIDQLVEIGRLCRVPEGRRRGRWCGEERVVCGRLDRHWDHRSDRHGPPPIVQEVRAAPT